jgi:RNA polymerase sigma-70 factor, ECF subfamily
VTQTPVRRSQVAAPAKPSREERASELYKKYGALIYSRCRRMLRDDAAAEDATQEVFIRVLRHIDAAPDEKSALPWLYRICTNFCLNHLRDRKRFVDAINFTRDEPIEDFEQVAIDRDLARRVLKQTNEKLSRPAVLHYVEGLKQEQVAKTLGVCRRTIIYRLGRFAEEAKRFATAAGDRVAA